MLNRVRRERVKSIAAASSDLLLRLLSCECIDTIAELGIDRRLLVVELEGLGGTGRSSWSSSTDVLSGDGGLFVPALWWL